MFTLRSKGDMRIDMFKVVGERQVRCVQSSALIQGLIKV